MTSRHKERGGQELGKVHSDGDGDLRPPLAALRLTVRVNSLITRLTQACVAIRIPRARHQMFASRPLAPGVTRSLRMAAVMSCRSRGIKAPSFQHHPSRLPLAWELKIDWV